MSRSVAAYVSTVGGSTDSHLGVDSVDLCLRSVFASPRESESRRFRAEIELVSKSTV